MFEMYYLTKPNPNNVWGWFKSGVFKPSEKFFLIPDIQSFVFKNIRTVRSEQWKVKSEKWKVKSEKLEVKSQE